MPGYVYRGENNVRRNGRPLNNPSLEGESAALGALWREMYEQGVSTPKLAVLYGCAERTVRTYIRQAGGELVRLGDRTHCRRGHEYTEKNTRFTKEGHRQCRLCDRDMRRVGRAKENT